MSNKPSRLAQAIAVLLLINLILVVISFFALQETRENTKNTLLGLETLYSALTPTTTPTFTPTFTPSTTPTPTFTPSFTFTPEFTATIDASQAACLVVVSVNDAPLLMRPSLEANIILDLSSGQILGAVARDINYDWIQVFTQYPYVNAESIGWTSRRFLNIPEGCLLTLPLAN